MGLIGGMARTAVIAGTATAVSNNVSRRQSQKWSAQEAQQQAEMQAAVAAAQPAPAPQAPVDPTVAQLEQLANLKAQGVITQEEFDAKKKQILGI